MAEYRGYVGLDVHNLRRDDMLPTREVLPTRGHPFPLGFDTNALEAKVIPAIHSRHRKPQVGVVQFRQRFQDRESELPLIYQPSPSLTNDLMDMSLDCEKHFDRDVSLILRLEIGQKRLVALLPRDIDGRSPRAF